MTYISFSLLFVLLFLIFLPSSSPISSTTTAGPPCHPDECSALLQLKSSFSIVNLSQANCFQIDSNGKVITRTSSWSKNTNCCKWDGITCDNVTGHVIDLYLSCSRLEGPIRSNSSLFFLHHLQTLYLSGNDFSGSPIWPEFGQFKNMTRLDLSGSNFSGNVPLELSHLSKLVSLVLGDVPLEFFFLFKLVSSGKLSIEVATFKALARNLTHLEELFFFGINMSLVPPASMMNLSSSLTSLGLYDCQLPGQLPENTFQFHNLQSLVLQGNYLSGQIPWSSFNLEQLFQLDLSHNNFTGQIPEVYYNSTQKLSSYDSSKYPLKFFDLSSNQIHGSVPKWLWELGKNSLTNLNLSHNSLTYMEPLPWNKLQILDLRSNLFLGPLPISSSPNLTNFLLSNNKFAGEIPTFFCNMTFLEMLDVSYNNLSGVIPPCLGSLSNTLSVLDLRMNRFHGFVPPAFGKGCNLKTLNLNGNQLEGSLPQSLFNCQDLELLDIGDNNINGSFPQWLESLPKLQVLILKSNGFFGPISNPKVILPFQNLRIIDLSNNKFTGQLPTEYFENFRTMMDAHADHLEYMGSTDSYYQDSVVLVIKGFELQLEKILTVFTTIDFSRNKFEGEIPRSIGKLRSLKGLNFSYNRLAGLIPSSLGNLSNLEWLDLSSNELYGNIPLELAADLNQLAKLNLSNNKLVGPIPRGTQFNTFNGDSYSGNPGLCGFPLPECDDDKAQQDEGDDKGDEDVNDSGMIDWKVVMMGYGSGLVIGVSVGYMVLFSRGFDYWFSKRFGGRPRHISIAPLRGQRRN